MATAIKMAATVAATVAAMEVAVAAAMVYSGWGRSCYLRVVVLRPVFSVGRGGLLCSWLPWARRCRRLGTRLSLLDGNSDEDGGDSGDGGGDGGCSGRGDDLQRLGP
jgi:uncharacterized membrane protein YgcG